MSSLRRGHANLLCIVPILSDDPKVSVYKYETTFGVLAQADETFQWPIQAAIADHDRKDQNSDAGTRTRVSWVRAKYPNQLDYIG